MPAWLQSIALHDLYEIMHKCSKDSFSLYFDESGYFCADYRGVKVFRTAEYHKMAMWLKSH